MPNPPKRGIKSYLNPKNWGVVDLSSEPSFNKAFEKAKRAGAFQFLYGNGRYTTESNLTPQQQLKRYGIVDEQRLPQTGLIGRTRRKLADNLYAPDAYSGTNEIGGAVEISGSPYAVYNRVYKSGILNKKEDKRTQFDKYAQNPELLYKKLEDALLPKGEISEDFNSRRQIVRDIANNDLEFFKNQTDYTNLYFGKPQHYGSAKISGYKPSKSKDVNTNYYTSDAIKAVLKGIASGNEKFPKRDVYSDIGGFTGNFTLSSGKDEKGEYISYYDIWDLAPTGDQEGPDESRGLGKPFEFYDRIYLDEVKPKPMSPNKKAYGGYTNMRKKKYAFGDYYSKPLPDIREGIDFNYHIPKMAPNSITNSGIRINNNNLFTRENNQFAGNLLNTVGTGLGNMNQSNIEPDKVDAGVDAGISAVGAINPIIGGALKLGQGIGKQTVNKDGLYKSKTGEFIDNSFNPTTGIRGLIDTAKDFDISTLGNKLSLGLFGESATQRKLRARKRSAELDRINDIENYSQGVLANYPTYGYAKYGMNFKKMGYPNGGTLPYPVDGSGYSTLASDMVQYHGNTHENGGINLDTNQDNVGDIEIEDKEVIKDNKVFSDRIRPSDNALQILDSMKIDYQPGDSYATITSRIGRTKGLYENKFKSTRPGAKGTAKLMTKRLDDMANLLFEDQQIQNRHLAADNTKVVNPNMDYLKDQEPPTDLYSRINSNYLFKKINRGYATGGPIKKFRGERIAETQTNLPYGAWNYSITSDPLIDKELPGLDVPTPLNSREALTSGVDFNYSIPTGINKNTIPSNTASTNDSVVSNTNLPTLREFNIGDYKGDIAAGIGTAVNQALINRLETNFEPSLVDSPRYTYTNRLPYLTRTLGAQFQGATRGLSTSSAQDNNAIRANMYAKTLDALNNAVDSETQRKDAFDSRYSDLVNRTNTINTQLKNASKQLGLENRNQRLALTQANIDNVIRSYMGNQAQRDASEIDFIKSYLQFAKEGDTGVANRLINQLPDRAKRRIGFSTYANGGIYIKPENRGKFTTWADSHNMGVQEAASHIMANKDRYSSTLIKRANFARNAAKWN